MSAVKGFVTLVGTVLSFIFAGMLGLQILPILFVEPGTPAAENVTADAVEGAVEHSFPLWLSFLVDPLGIILLVFVAVLIAAAIRFAPRG